MQSRALEPFFPGFSYVRLFGAYSEPNPFINEVAKPIRGNKENWKEEALDNLVKAGNTNWGAAVLIQTPVYRNAV